MAPLLPDLDASLVPTRTDDPAEAAWLMHEHGACILTGMASGQDAADALARLVLGDRVVAAPQAIAVREGGDQDRKVREEAANEVPLPMHTDGFTYGHDAPARRSKRSSSPASTATSVPARRTDRRPILGAAVAVPTVEGEQWPRTPSGRSAVSAPPCAAWW